MGKILGILAAALLGGCIVCSHEHEERSSVTITRVESPVAAGSAPATPATDLKSGCARGDQDACGNLLGDEHLGAAAIIAFLTKTCDAGTLPACNSLGVAKLEGKLVAKDVAGAIALWTKTCDAKNGLGCNNLGAAQHEGFAGDKDLKQALAYFQNGCGYGWMRACDAAGQMLGDGDGVPQDVPAATKLLAQSCAGKSADGCRMLLNAARLLAGADAAKPEDMQLAIKSFQQLCDADNGAGCAEAAWRLETTAGLAKDPAVFTRLYERGCKLDDGSACFHAARLAHNAAGFEHACRLHEARACDEAVKPYLAAKQVTQAFPFLEEACRLDDRPACVSACKLGDADGCYSLGLRYKTGDRFGKDDAFARGAARRAIELRTKGCAANDPKSCFDLAYTYDHDGEGEKVDHPRAKALTEKACKLGALDACFNLGERKENAINEPEDLPGAVAVFQDVCTRGYASACGSLAFMYMGGKGVAKDPARATSLFGKGCSEACAWCCFEGAKLVVASDRDAGTAKFRSACRWGDNRGCAELGKLGIAERMDPTHTTVTTVK
jgi:TPR repeat protein